MESIPNWLAGIGAVVAAVASAYSAWQSSVSSKLAAREAMRASERAAQDLHRLAVERLTFAIDAAVADRRRGEALTLEAKTTNSLREMLEPGHSSRKTLIEGECHAKLAEIHEQTQDALARSLIGAVDYSSMTTEELDTIRIAITRGRTRVAVVLDELARIRDECQSSIDRRTQMRQQ